MKYLKELFKLVFRVSYLMGWMVGYHRGFFGLYNTTTDDEIRANKMFDDYTKEFYNNLIKNRGGK